MAKNDWKAKRGQEEMVGFALIVLIVAVILIIFLGLSLGKKNTTVTESYEVENFVQAMLQYTTQCQNNFGYDNVKDLITDCRRHNQCLNSQDSCAMLNSTLNNLLDASWPVGKENPVKGYLLNINSSTGKEIMLQKGNATSNSKGAYQSLPDVTVNLMIYN